MNFLERLSPQFSLVQVRFNCSMALFKVDTMGASGIDKNSKITSVLHQILSLSIIRTHSFQMSMEHCVLKRKQ